MSSSRKSTSRPSRWRTARTRRSGPVGAAREERLDPRGEVGLGQGPPERLEGQPESVQRSNPRDRRGSVMRSAGRRRPAPPTTATPTHASSRPSRLSRHPRSATVQHRTGSRRIATDATRAARYDRRSVIGRGRRSSRTTRRRSTRTHWSTMVSGLDAAPGRSTGRVRGIAIGLRPIVGPARAPVGGLAVRRRSTRRHVHLHDPRGIRRPGRRLRRAPRA